LKRPRPEAAIAGLAAKALPTTRKSANKADGCCDLQPKESAELPEDDFGLRAATARQRSSEQSWRQPPTIARLASLRSPFAAGPRRNAPGFRSRYQDISNQAGRDRPIVTI
jgi:hypothetical protein